MSSDPSTEVDLESQDDLEDLHREITLGRASARDEPLVEHEAVLAGALEHLRVRL